MRRLLVLAILFPLAAVGFAQTRQGLPSPSREIRETSSDPGRVTARRLNRNEYNNTIRDLLGVDVRPADDFPQDDSGYGFDNIGDVLSMSPALMEKYVTAAERVARLALFGPAPMKPTVTRLRSDGRRVREARAVPAEYDITGLSLPNAFHAIYRVPVDGEYVVRTVLAGIRPKASEPITVSLWIDQQEVRSLTHDPEASASFGVDRQDFGGQTAEFRVTLTSGDRWLAVAIPRIYEGLPARYGGPNPSKRPSPPPAAKPEDIPLNGARVNFVEIAGPYSQAAGPSRESVEKIYTCGHGNDGHRRSCAVRVVADLARRAFRRPIGQRELDKFVGLVRLAERQERSAFARGSGSELRRTSPFKEGLAVGIQALLVSPDFLFRIERDTRTAAAHPITQRELATRLSYFLWASTPDVELRRAADRGTLGNPRVLASEVRRMLRDPKARALAEHFGGQWLQFRALESVTRDRDRFPDFEDYLRLSMRRETELFVEDIVREDRSILDFIDGKYSFINERLARHYGIPGVSGPAFRRVDLTGSPRGGVLTHASVLTVSSYFDADLAGAAGQMDSRKPAQHSAAGSARRRPEPGRDRHHLRRRHARAARGASQEPDLRRLPPTHGSAWLRPRELRRGRRLACRRWKRSGRRIGRAAGWTPLYRPRGAANNSQGRSRRVCEMSDVQTAHLRAGARPRAVRCQHGQADCEPPAGV